MVAEGFLVAVGASGWLDGGARFLSAASRVVVGIGCICLVTSCCRFGVFSVLGRSGSSHGFRCWGRRVLHVG